MTKGKAMGFYITRKRESWRCFLSSHWFWFLVLLGLVWIVGLTRAWSQSSEPKSNDSETTLAVWENISLKFQNELTLLRTDLQGALSDATQSKNYSERLTNLYETSLQRIKSLELYNSQIAERMQERDEDLTWAYSKIDQVEKRFLKSLIVNIILGVTLAGIIFLKFGLKKF